MFRGNTLFIIIYIQQNSHDRNKDIKKFFQQRDQRYLVFFVELTNAFWVTLILCGGDFEFLRVLNLSVIYFLGSFYSF